MADHEAIGADQLPALGAELVVARSGLGPEPCRAANVSMMLHLGGRDLAVHLATSRACALFPLPSDSSREVGR